MRALLIYIEGTDLCSALQQSASAMSTDSVAYSCLICSSRLASMLALTIDEPLPGGATWVRSIMGR